MLHLWHVGLFNVNPAEAKEIDMAKSKNSKPRFLNVPHKSKKGRDIPKMPGTETSDETFDDTGGDEQVIETTSVNEMNADVSEPINDSLEGTLSSEVCVAMQTFETHVAKTLDSVMKSHNPNQEEVFIKSLQIDNWNITTLIKLMKNGADILMQKRTELERQFDDIERAFGHVTQAIPERHAGTVQKTGRGGPGRKRVSKFIYVHPKNEALSWSGIGMKPVWVRELESEGVELQDIKHTNPNAL